MWTQPNRPGIFGQKVSHLALIVGGGLGCLLAFNFSSFPLALLLGDISCVLRGP